MSDYEYTDRDKDKLIVMNAARYKGDILYVGVIRGDQEFGVDVRNEDAPAIALAILEAAGYEPSDTPAWKTGSPTGVRVVVNILQEHVETLAKKAEREAEDAKVREFFSTMWPIAYHNTGRVTDMMRAEYNAARKFFEEA